MTAPPPVLFRDDRFVVLDKPAGLPVHPGPRGGPCVEDCFPLLSRRREGPWLAHRLDTDTSGCLLVALRRAALHAAQACFAAGTVRKTYWAVVAGDPGAEHGVMAAPLLKRTAPSGWRMVVDPAGQPARTAWRVLARAPGLAWLELHPHTGRTHQIRIHCAAVLGCPLLGDPVYGAPVYRVPGEGGAGGLHLLARALHVPLAPPVDAQAAPAGAMARTLARFTP